MFYLRVDTADSPSIIKYFKHIILEPVKSSVSALKPPEKILFIFLDTLNNVKKHYNL